VFIRYKANTSTDFATRSTFKRDIEVSTLSAAV